MNCSRNGCKNIMCNKYSNEFGYICDECFEELAENGDCNIQDFMLTEKEEKQKNSKNWRQYISEIFKTFISY